MMWAWDWMEASRAMIGSDTAQEGLALISTAIGELMEDAAADAVRMEQDGWQVMVVRADRLKAVGTDVTRLADALEVLARRAGEGRPASRD